jgi:hypothetical protein
VRNLLIQLFIPFIRLGISGLSYRPVSYDHLDIKSPPLSTQFDKPRIAANKVTLLVDNIFKDSRVALPIYLRDVTIELGLLRSVQYDALNVTVNKVIIIILLKNLGS